MDLHFITKVSIQESSEYKSADLYLELLKYIVQPNSVIIFIDINVTEYPFIKMHVN